MRLFYLIILFFQLVNPALAMEPSSDWVDVCQDPEQEIELIDAREPLYPTHAFFTCMEGLVTVEMLVNKLGHVQSATVTESSMGDVGESIINGVKQWVFLPACRGGSPIERTAVQQFDFTIDSDWGCPETIDEPTTELLAELLSLHGFVAEQESQIWRESFQYPQYEPKFAGELGEIERFHLQQIKAYLDMLESVTMITSDRIRADFFNAERLKADIDFDETRKLLDQLRADLVSNEDTFDQYLENLFNDLTVLRENSSISEQNFRFLVSRFYGNYNDYYSAEHLEEIAQDKINHQRMIDLYEAALIVLHENRDAWGVKPGGSMRVDFYDGNVFSQYIRPYTYAGLITEESRNKKRRHIEFMAGR